MKQIVGSGMNPYKLVETNTKFRPNIPPEYQNDILYNSAKEDDKKFVKEEKIDRDEMKSKKRQKLSKKLAIKMLEEEAAEGAGEAVQEEMV